MENKRLDKIFEVSFLIILCIQVLVLFAFNLKKVPYMLDSDAANAIYHLEQIAKNGLNIPNWNHTTTLEIDSSLMFAYPIYKLSGNVFLSLGIANMVLIMLYIVVIFAILHYAKVERGIMYFTMFLVVTPWAFGMLDYVNMLFFSASQYSVKVLVPLLALLVLIMFGRYQQLTKREKIFAYLAAFMYVILLFMTSLSTGVYTMICGVFPIVIMMILDLEIRGKVDKSKVAPRIIFVGVSVVVFIIGYMSYRYLYQNPSKYNMSLVKTGRVKSLMDACFVGMFQLFGALSDEGIKGVSLEGIYYCCKIFFVCFLMIVSIINLVGLFKREEKAWLSKFLNFLFFMNYVLLMVYDTRFEGNTVLEYRYLLIGAVPLILLVGITINEWKFKWNPLQKYSVYFICALIGGVCLIGNTNAMYQNKDKSTYAVDICNYVQELPVESLIFVNDEDTSNLCRALDSNHRFGAFDSEERKMILSGCSYEEEAQPEYYGENNALAVIQGNNLSDIISEEAASHYTLVGSVRWFDIYVSDQTVFYW